MMRVLAVDDDEAFVFALQRMLRPAGMDVMHAGSGRQALDLTAGDAWDAVLLDLGLPDLPGLEVLRTMVNERRPSPVIVLSGRDEADVATTALRLGAMHYITKSTVRENLLRVIGEAQERTGLRQRLEQARTSAPSVKIQPLGESPAWRVALEDLRAAARAPRTPVLITGESGTGKEVAASLVHAWSDRARGPFVSVNASCFSASLLDSELFGHEAGAFTGALGSRRGLFELSSGGTLFLDEVGELPLELQPKLLRVLEGHPFRRVGGERPVAVDVRVVSATNRRLEEAVTAGRFRRDLFHRLRVVEVSLPPLRSRGGDCEALALHFATQVASELGKETIDITPEALKALCTYPWPGNVRELRNAVERAVVLGRDDRIKVCDLPPEVREAASSAAPGPALRPAAGPRRTEQRELCAVVKEHILDVYREAGGNLARAARDLGIGRATLRRHLREYGVMSGDQD